MFPTWSVQTYLLEAHIIMRLPQGFQVFSLSGEAWEPGAEEEVRSTRRDVRNILCHIGNL